MSNTKAIDLQQELTSGFAGSYIRWKARRLVGHANLKHTDRRDIEQELSLALFRAFPNFDPDKAHWRSFAATVIERRAGRFLKRRRARKRQEQHSVGSLNHMVRDADGCEVLLSEQLREEHREALTGRYAPSPVEQTEAMLDVSEVLASLPPDLQDICRRLSRDSQRQVAEDLQMSRRTLRDVLTVIRERFIDAGLGEKFEKVTAHSRAKGEA